MCYIIFVEWLEEYEKPNFKELWQIYELSVPGSSGTIGSAI
jgi:hypothetical protein